MQNLNNLNNLNALGIKGNYLFNPASIKDSNGNKLLLQQLLTKQRPTIDGVVYDERTNKGTARPIQLGRCYNFDGTNDYIDCGTGIDVFKDSTKSWKINMNYIPSSVTGARRLVAQALGSGTYRGVSIFSNGINFEVNIISTDVSDSINVRANGFAFVVGTTYAIEVTYSGNKLASGVVIKINGTTYANTVVSNTLTSTNINSSSNLLIGRDTSSYYISGKAWGIVITDTATNTVVRNFKCDEQAGTTAYDSSGNGVHGTITNATLATFHSTQDIYSYQNEVGYSPYIRHSDTASYYSASFSGGTTNATIRFKFISTDTSGVIVHDIGSGSRYALVFTQGSALTTLNQGCGTPTYTIDGVLFTGTTRGELYTALCDGKKHDVVISNLNLSSWTNITVGGYSGVLLTGIVFDLSVEKTTGTTSHSWKFYGDTPATDIVGSSNMVASGTLETVLIPRDEVNTTLDVFGNPLQYTGQVPYNGILKSSNCLDFNGTNQYATLGAGISVFNDSTNSWKVKIKFIPDTISGIHRLVAQQVGSGTFKGISVYHDGSSLRADIVSNVITQQMMAVANGLTLVAGTYYEVEVSYNGSKLASGVTWLVNGVAYGSIDGVTNTLTNSDIASAQPLNIGRDSSSLYYDGKIMYTEVLDGSNVSQVRYTFAEGVGTILYDSSGNGRHMTLYNAPTWSTQNSYHANIVNGFRPYINLDGTSGAIRYPNTVDVNLSGATIRTKFKITPQGTWKGAVVAKGGLAGGWLIGAFSGNTLRVYIKQAGISSDHTAFDSTETFAVNTTYDLDITFTQSAIISATRNGVPMTFTQTVAPTGVYGDTTAGFSIGDREQFIPYTYQGRVSNVQIYKDGVLKVDSDVAILSGTTCINKADTSKNGTLSGGYTRPFIPALNTTTDIFNATLTNPAGAYHNGAETTIDMSGGVASPIAVINAWETTWAFNTARENPKFSRTILSGSVYYADRFLAYREKLTGTNLEKVLAYVKNTDTDADTYITAVETALSSTLSAKQKNIIRAFVANEKSTGRWNNIKQLFLPIWGNETANAICVKTCVSGTFAGTFTHGTGFVKGNGVNNIFRTTLSPSTAGLSNASGSLFALIKTAPSGTGFAGHAGAVEVNKSVQLYTSSTAGLFQGSCAGPNVTANYTSPSRADHFGIYASSRISATDIRLFRRYGTSFAQVGATVATDVSAYTPTAVNMGYTCQTSDGLATNIPSDAEYGAYGMQLGLTTTQAEQFTINLKKLWEQLTTLTT